jgi:hypothetical protein
MKKIRTPSEGAGAALSTHSTTTSNSTPQTPPEAVLSGFFATTEHFLAASQSAATKRAYASDLRHFFANGGSFRQALQFWRNTWPHPLKNCPWPPLSGA